MKKLYYFLLVLPLFLIVGCSENQSIVNNIDERDANEILVFLASKGIDAQKVRGAAGGPGEEATLVFNIMVDPNKSIQAMALLNQVGLPRKQGTTLLALFAKSGLMSTDKEENIRYQAGIEEELKNTIRKIDGVLDADVQISFPSAEVLPGAEKPKIKAAVYVKHQGILDDPNNHLESKIKRLLAGSIENLSFENVSVISDRSRIADIQLEPNAEAISSAKKTKEYVSIWSVIMTQNSATRFRVIFFTLIGVILAFGGFIGWLLYKFYPLLKDKITKKGSSDKENPPT